MFLVIYFLIEVHITRVFKKSLKANFFLLHSLNDSFVQPENPTNCIFFFCDRTVPDTEKRVVEHHGGTMWCVHQTKVYFYFFFVLLEIHTQKKI